MVVHYFLMQILGFWHGVPELSDMWSFFPGKVKVFFFLGIKCRLLCGGGEQFFLQRSVPKDILSGAGLLFWDYPKCQELSLND